MKTPRLLKRIVPILALALVFSLPASAFAAIAYDTSAGGYFQNEGGGTKTISYTVGSITNGVLVLCTNEGSNMTISSPQWNGASLTSVTTVIGTNDRGSRAWLILNPDTGTHNLTLSKSTSGTGSFSYHIYSFAGVGQTSQPETSNTGYSGAGTSVSADLTTSTVGDVIVGCGGNWSNNASAPTGTTGFNNNQTNGSGNWESAFYQRAGNGDVLAGTGSQTVNISFAVSLEMGILSLALSPAANPVIPDQQGDFVMFGEW